LGIRGNMTVSELTGKGFVGLLALIASAMIAFASWVTVSITATPSRTEVAEMIKDLAPYTDDRNMILEAVKESKKNGNLLGS